MHKGYVTLSGWLEAYRRGLAAQIELYCGLPADSFTCASNSSPRKYVTDLVFDNRRRKEGKGAKGNI